jgi:tetratricopeptide (TPR) repeat protein
MSEGVGEARPEAEGELALARLALDNGDYGHAASHAGYAVGIDPTLWEAYGLLDALAARVRDAIGLFSLQGEPYMGTVAARSYLLARYGAIDDAFGLLCQVATAAPGKPWAAGWLAASQRSAAGFADRMDPDKAAVWLSRLAGSLPDPTDPAIVAMLSPFLQVARCLVARYPDNVSILPWLSALARRFGAHDEAIAWCQRAERAGGYYAGVMLGYALRRAGRRDQMYEAWQRALGLDRGNVDLRVDIAENLARDGQLKEGLAWLEDGLALEPDHPKAFPSACHLRFRLDGDVGHLVRLADWWRDHPEHDYAHTMLAMACDNRPWLGMVPPATESVAGVLRQFAASERRGERVLGMSVAMSALEAPSALSVLRSAAPGAGIRGSGAGGNPATPEPDIRAPLAEVRYRLWAYAGVEARPVPPVPSAAAVAAVHSVAAGGYPQHPVAAYDLAVNLSGLGVADLLGLMAHVVPPPDTPQWREAHQGDPTYWPRSAQAWACLGLLHHQTRQPWPSSERRQVLADLLWGVEDWATDAAMNALVVAAWADPAIRDDVAKLVCTRFLAAAAAYSRRAVTIIEPMAHLVLATPGMISHVSEVARTILQLGAAPGEPAGRARPAAGTRDAGQEPRARRGFFRRLCAIRRPAGGPRSDTKKPTSPQISGPRRMTG